MENTSIITNKLNEKVTILPIAELVLRIYWIELWKKIF